MVAPSNARAAPTSDRFSEYTRGVRASVKCRPWQRGVFRALVGASVFASLPGHGQILFGPGPSGPRPPAPLDPRIPRGSEAHAGTRPAEGGPPGCSFRYPVCVHPGSSRKAANALEWVTALEDAYERLVGALGLPPPRDDWGRGGSPALDLYLAPSGTALRVEPDDLEVGGGFDEASAFCVAAEDEVPVARAATLCVAEAIALRIDASETPFSRRALATELWWSTGAPTSADAAAIDDAQAEPERGIVARDLTHRAEGGALLLDYLDLARGRGAPSGVGLATYALSAGPASPVGLRYTNEPDTLDVLRATFGPTPSDVARLFGDFALARAFLGSRDAEGRWPSLAWVGDFGRVRFEWSVPWDSLPRTLAPAHPVEPTGSTYLWVAIAGDAHESLVFQADTEPPSPFRWVIVLVDRNGRAMRRIDVPFLERETHVERVVGDVSGASGVLIAGTNLGGIGPSYPFDPDFAPFEPHAYTVYLAKQ